MRPTELSLRSPKEWTPDPYSVKNTYDGRSLFTAKATRKASFNKARRFSQYEATAQTTSFRVGPGAYEVDLLAINRLQARKTPLYRSFHGTRHSNVNGYNMVGNLLLDCSPPKKRAVSRSVHRARTHIRASSFKPSTQLALTPDLKAVTPSAKQPGKFHPCERIYLQRQPKIPPVHAKR